MRIIDLSPEDEPFIRQAAELLVVSFREHWPSAWPDMDAALAEVHEALAPGKICRVALDEAGAVLGWVGGIRGYGGNVWELHPLVVRPDRQRQGSAGRWSPIWRRRCGRAAGSRCGWAVTTKMT